MPRRGTYGRAFYSPSTRPTLDRGTMQGRLLPAGTAPGGDGWVVDGSTGSRTDLDRGAAREGFSLIFKPGLERIISSDVGWIKKTNNFFVPCRKSRYGMTGQLCHNWAPKFFFSGIIGLCLEVF